MDKLWQSFWKLKFMKNQALELHSPLPKSFKVCKEGTMEKRKTEDSSYSLLWNFWSTSRSPFSTCYIPFQSSESQESNSSNHVRVGAEMRKIWPLEDNCIKLRDNFARWKSRCEIPQSKVWEFRTHQTKVRNWNSNVRIFPCFCRLHTRSFLLDIFV